MKVVHFQSPVKGAGLARSKPLYHLRSRCAQDRVYCRKRVTLAAARSPDRDPERQDDPPQASTSQEGCASQRQQRSSVLDVVGTGTLASLACLGGGGGNGLDSGFGGDGGGGGQGGNPLFEIADADE